MAARLLVVAAAAGAALSYSNTSPLVAWSSSGSNALDALPSQPLHAVSLFQDLFRTDDVCEHDAVVLIQHPGLHASDLRSLPPHTDLSQTLRTSPSARQFPYVPSHPDFDVADIAHGVSQRCGSRMLSYTPGQEGVDVAEKNNKKHVVCMKMPHLDHSGADRKAAMREHEILIAMELESLAGSFPNHLVIYTGTPLLSKRQEPDSPDRPVLDLSSPPSSSSSPAAHNGIVFTNANTTLPSGGILKKYQILNPEVIMALLVSLFVLVPILVAGLSALASIQNPVRSDVSSKTFNAHERKNQ